FVKYLMKRSFREFINEVKNKKYIQLEDLIPLYDDFIEDFFSRDYIDKIVEVEVYNNKKRLVA
ncbi:MAG: hypothetical protein FWG98_02895, partial [Candidatus Cloacimonetes bacterium]|nr:hypothetical protein [Candidatus Cloacimonadota bacterium]